MSGLSPTWIQTNTQNATAIRMRNLARSQNGIGARRLRIQYNETLSNAVSESLVTDATPFGNFAARSGTLLRLGFGFASKATCHDRAASASISSFETVLSCNRALTVLRSEKSFQCSGTRK